MVTTRLSIRAVTMVDTMMADIKVEATTRTTIVREMMTGMARISIDDDGFEF